MGRQWSILVDPFSPLYTKVLLGVEMATTRRALISS